MTDSILVSIRELSGPDGAYDAFDTDLLVSINSAFMILNQLGVGPEEPFVVTGTEETWSDFMPTGKMEAVKTYVQMYVKLHFDPPDNSFKVNILDKQLKELEWRLNVMAETP